jgi:Pyruvate/2-oxoacid:ferredoxin oxidoreductase delta subunit
MKKAKRKIIQIDEERCDGCGLCVPSCAEGAIRIVDGKARLVADKFCDGLGACLGECPNDALKVIERDAEEFDEKAVEEHLHAAPESVASAAPPAMPCGCPSTQIRSFAGTKPACPGAEVREVAPAASALAHWPVQIRLVPPTAPFLRGADLLVLADCVGAAYPDLHRDLLPGKVVMMGCPKFDDADAYVEKFAEIFRTAGLKRVTVAIMEVPCCGGLYQIVVEAMRAAGASVPLETVVIGVTGNRLQRARTSAS